MRQKTRLAKLREAQNVHKNVQKLLPQTRRLLDQQITITTEGLEITKSDIAVREKVSRVLYALVHAVLTEVELLTLAQHSDAEVLELLHHTAQDLKNLRIIVDKVLSQPDAKLLKTYQALVEHIQEETLREAELERELETLLGEH